jgi:acetolactate synthase-1/3 small subunit
VSRFTIVVRATRELVSKVALQIERIIEVLGVSVSVESDLIAKEIALFEVSAADPAARQRITQLARKCGAALVGAGERGFVIEKTGSESEVNRLYEQLAPFGITQFVRSGRIAVLKNPASYAEAARVPAAQVS